MTLREREKQKNREEYQKKVKIKNKKTWITFIIIFLVIILIFPVGKFIGGLVGVHISYSDGERSINVIKIAEKGLIWRTVEAEGVLSQNGFSVTYVWDFSIDNNDPNKEELLKELQRAFETGQTVKVKYEQMAGTVPWRGKTTYFIKEIRCE
ncbi:MAG: hypothetical protein PHT54_02475 [Candidatus Nanoarchaeia archaeon]|nr:hypothetical protein [Candidatus Nanoarchaeia archaeon]